VAFSTITEARLVLGELGKVLTVESKDGTEIHCTLSLRQSIKDTGAYALFEAEGAWGELYTGKEELIRTKEQGAAILKAQLNMMITRSKWPKANRGDPQNRTKLIFTAVRKPGEEPLYPTCITVEAGPYTKPMRYRMDPDKFQGRCKGCHQEDAGCVCRAMKDRLDTAKAFRGLAYEKRQEQPQQPPSQQPRKHAQRPAN